MKKTYLILILISIMLIACSCNSTPTENPGDGSDNFEGNGGSGTDITINEDDYAQIHRISTCVQEQMLNTYDRYVDKDNNDWEESWTESTVTPTAFLKIGVGKGASATLTNNFHGTPYQAVSLDQNIPSGAISVLIELSADSVLADNGCVLNGESKRTYKNVNAGTISSGMLLIEKSTDGVNWQRTDSTEYQNGLFTTNFRSHYGSGNTVSVYTPSGEDLNSGIYIRITYIYEAEHTYIGKGIFGQSKEKTDDKIFREQSVFFVCNEDLDGVTFHNMSLSDEYLSEIVTDESGSILEEYKSAETMQDQAMTITGFRIDNHMKNVNVTVSKSGNVLPIPEDGTFTENGKYVITLQQEIGSMQKTLTLFVDNRPVDEIIRYYFGDSFIEGKRIYWEGDYPMYEDGYNNYYLAATSAEFPAIYGSLVNSTTGDISDIFNNRLERSAPISGAGEYTVTFCNNPTFQSDTPSGDARIITFRFVVIAHGTAPGPQVNKESLNKYAGNHASDYYPKYYGVTYSSAGPGYITLVFSNYQDAFDFAYNYEKGCVEKQPDGSYRYSGSLVVSSKVKYDSVWDLTEATNHFASLAVQELYFDLTDSFTYLTLEESVLAEYENLRTLELSKSVVIFQSEEHRRALTAGNALPNISSKKYQYLTPGLQGSVLAGTDDFKFVKDKNGYDSATVTIVDSTGKEIPIRYNESVGEQLREANCAIGIVTIKEATVYGDCTEYQAIYMDENTNTTVGELLCTLNGLTQSISISQNSAGNRIQTNLFSFKNMRDELDPFSFIKVIYNGKESHYMLDEAMQTSWSAIGEYEIAFTNRMGCSYSIYVSIQESNYVNITFAGIGTNDLVPITAEKSQGTIDLPQISRYGFTLIGYTDSHGNLHTSTLQVSNLPGDIVLSPVWEAKEFTLTIQDSLGNVLQTLTVKYGESYILPTPILTDGVFEGWLLGDQPLEDGIVTISEEGDIVVIACTRYDEHGQQSEGGCKSVLPVRGMFTIILVMIATASLLRSRKILRNRSKKVFYEKNH